MDESGVLGGTAQRFFTLGLMKTVASGPFGDAAHRVLDRAISTVPGGAPGFESEGAGCVGNSGPSPGRVFNACMLDSCSSLSLQVVDLILGGVRHSFLASREPGVPRDAHKDAISMRIRQQVGPQILAASFTGQKPRYFDVRELTP